MGSQATTDQLTPSLWASQVVLVVKNPPTNAANIRDAGWIPGSGRSPGGGQTTHPVSLAWKIPWTEVSGGLQSVGWQKVRLMSEHAHTHTLYIYTHTYIPIYI